MEGVSLPQLGHTQIHSRSLNLLDLWEYSFPKLSKSGSLDHSGLDSILPLLKGFHWLLQMKQSPNHPPPQRSLPIIAFFLINFVVYSVIYHYLIYYIFSCFHLFLLSEFCILLCLKRSLTISLILCEFAVSSVRQNQSTQNTKSCNKCFNKSEMGSLCSSKMLVRKLDAERLKKVTLDPGRSWNRG